MPKDFLNGLADIYQGPSRWRKWSVPAWNDVRWRYRRSGLGQFWLTLSMVATIGGLGFVCSHLFAVNVSTYLPNIAVTFVAWAIISSVVVESCNALTENDHMLQHISLARSLFALRVIARKFHRCDPQRRHHSYGVCFVPCRNQYQYPELTVGLGLLVGNSFWIGYFPFMCAIS
jgi:ABC-type polysaccharide/polyol phosphate export permease